jgi:Tfp pilus assembly protein PilO
MGNVSSIFSARKCRYTNIGLSNAKRAILFFVFLILIICQISIVLYLENKMAEVEDQEKKIKSIH